MAKNPLMNIMAAMGAGSAPKGKLPIAAPKKKAVAKKKSAAKPKKVMGGC